MAAAPSAPPTFLERALQEAARYGSDPWVFVRELIQNARDAGAGSVSFACAEKDNNERVSCRDDGEGMTFDHARRFLFTLYASSKEGRKGEAGKFGVGFWSILRFRPDHVVIRSWPRKGAPWEITLDGSLTRATRGVPPASRAPGTEIVISRAGGDRNLHRRVFDAAVQSARYSTRKDDPRRPLLITVDGDGVNEPFTLPAPSASFRRGGIRGVVGLGRAARVELFTKGLRVRSAAALEDLLAPPAKNAGHARVRFPELADGLAPRALLETEELELLLSRGDARESATLTRAVRLAQDELRRLIERQLDHARPAGRWRRFATSVPARIAGGALLAASVAFGGAWIGATTGIQSLSVPWAEPGGSDVAETRPAAAVLPSAYRDLGALYGGPRVDAFDASAAPIALTYEPANRELHIAALVLDGGEADGAPRVEPMRAGERVVAPAPCAGRDCVRFTLVVADGPGLLRIPVPSGHRLDPDSVRLDGKRVLVLDGNALPVISLSSPVRGTLRWTTGPLPPTAPPEKADARPESIPQEVERFARALRALPPEERIERALEWTRESVRYSTADDVAALHVAATGAGRGFLDRTLAIGAGDCDVQNGVLTALLRASGVDARLAIGFLGNRGRVAPWLHAWVEAAGEDGRWRVVDASEGGQQLNAPVLGPPPALSVAPTAEAETSTNGPTVAFPAPATRGRSSGRTFRAFGSRVRQNRGVAPLAIGATLGVGLALGFLYVGRTRRAVTLDTTHDVGALLQGALLHPAAFESVPAVFERPLVPLVGGGALSLGDAWRRAARSRLYSAHGAHALASRARGLGHPVVDVSTPEGAIVAGALAASDLDRWVALLERTRGGDALATLRTALRAHGEDLDVRCAEGIGAIPVVVEIPPAHRWRRAFRHGVRVVVVDATAPWTQTQRDGADAQRLLAGADQLFEALGIPAARAAVILAPLAKAALAEGAR